MSRTEDVEFAAWLAEEEASRPSWEEERRGAARVFGDYWSERPVEFVLRLYEDEQNPVRRIEVTQRQGEEIRVEWRV